MQPPTQDPDDLPPEPDRHRVVLIDGLIAAVNVAAITAAIVAAITAIVLGVVG